MIDRLKTLDDRAFYPIAFAIVFVVGWFLLGADRVGYALGVLAASVVYVVDIVRTES